MSEEKTKEKKKILIIDDDKTFCMTLTDTLEPLGYEVFQAKDGEKGLEMMATHNPDLILLDLLMPKVNGIEFLERVQKDREGGSMLPILITSNMDDLNLVSKTAQYGVRGYIVKSNESLDEITKTVESTINP